MSHMLAPSHVPTKSRFFRISSEVTHWCKTHPDHPLSCRTSDRTIVL